MYTTTTKAVELDARIVKFLEKKTAKFPDLHQEAQPGDEVFLAALHPAKAPAATARWDPR